MKLSVWLALATLAGGGLSHGAAAQDRVVRADEQITASGCLQRAQRNGSVGGTVVGTSASPDRADDEANSGEMVEKFLHSSATPVAGSGTPAATNSRSPIGTSGRAEPTSFGLEGHEAELGRHTGARVEVTGVLIPPASSGRGSGGAATEAGTRRIRVASFKVVNDRCEAP